MKDVWHVQRTLPANLKPKPLARPVMAALSLLVLAAMIVLFIFGENLPTHIVPPAVAIIGPTLGAAGDLRRAKSSRSKRC